MPVSFELDLPGRIVRVRMHGAISDADLIVADDELRASADFHPDFDQLVDTREAEGGEVTTSAIRELARRPPLFSQRSRRAFVVRNDVGYGLARIFQARRGDVAGEIQIFRSLAHAEHWLASGAGS